MELLEQLVGKAATKLLIINSFVLVLSVGTLAETNCGKLKDSQLYNNKVDVEPLEYTWIGLLLHVKGNISERTNCDVIIVGSQHVLTTAKCVQRFNNQPDKAAVLLGLWHRNHNRTKKYICNLKGFCVPAPTEYKVRDIIMHPHVDRDTGDNNVALLRLTEPIHMTDYVQPVCLQPRQELASLTNRNFQFSGFRLSTQVKGKGEAITLSRALCSERNPTAKQPPESQFCAYPEKRTTFYEGAPLMGQNIVDDVPESFYLVAILVDVYQLNKLTTTMFLFQDLRPSMQWILDTTADIK